MRRFVNGTGFDTRTGAIKIYMTKPKEMNFKINNLVVDGYKFVVDEFINKRDVLMLSFNSNIVTTDPTGAMIMFRRKITSIIKKLCDVGAKK